MSTIRRPVISKNACTRCSLQKRRCDRALPECGLCTRLRQPCMYKQRIMASLGPTPPPSPQPGPPFNSAVLTPARLKDDIIQQLAPRTPEEAITVYYREIEPWFPVVSIHRLQNQLQETWDDVPLDAALLCLCFVLLAATPPSAPEDDGYPSQFRSLYLHTKSYISLTEGLGLNSLLIVQSRILITMFEVAHGFYPAASISMGATVSAADALDLHPTTEDLHLYNSDSKPTEMETIITWCGILILDRYIAVNSGPNPSLTRTKYHPLQGRFKNIICPTHQDDQDRSSSICYLSRLFEASLLLDKTHAVLNSYTVEGAFNIDELILTARTVANLQKILLDEIGDEVHLYSGGLGICNLAQLLAAEHGSKRTLSGAVSEDCRYIAQTSLASILLTVSDVIGPFAPGTKPIDFNLFPPFVMFLVYKAAAIVTQQILVNDSSEDEVNRLRALRKFLRIVGERWLASEHYLKLLDEDTTPRLLKAVD